MSAHVREQTTHHYSVSTQYGWSASSASERCVAGLSSQEDVPRAGVPLTITRDQLYYWTPLWREGVAAARAALATGDFKDFTSDDPNDVIHWLYSAEDD